MPDASIPYSYQKVIGALPPGMGQGDFRRLKRPTFSRNAKDWDTCEEILWVRNLDLADLADGAEHSQDLRAAGYLGTTGRFWVTGFTQINELAGMPVIRLMMKGWQKTKADHWAARRATSGDVNAMNLGGFSYATRTYWAVTGDLAYTVLTAPSQLFGFTNGLLTPTYLTDWPYFLTGVTPGWYISSREIERLPNNTTALKITDTFARLMKYDGTNGT